MQAVEQLSGDVLDRKRHSGELKRDLETLRNALQRLDVCRGQEDVIHGRDRARDLHLGDLDGWRGVEPRSKDTEEIVPLRGEPDVEVEEVEASLGAADGGEEQGVAGGGEEGRVGQTGGNTCDALLEGLREEVEEEDGACGEGDGYRTGEEVVNAMR